MIRKYLEIVPQVAATAYVDAAANVIGAVTIGARSSVWPGTTLRNNALRSRGERKVVRRGLLAKSLRLAAAES